MRSHTALVALGSIFLLLFVAPSSAAPALSLGSDSDYRLTASFKIAETCGADNDTIAGFVCGGLSRTQSHSIVGSVNWTVVGLGDDALLSIDYDVTVSDLSGSEPRKVSSRSGIVEESIELSTRLTESGASNFFYGFPYVAGFPGTGYDYFLRPAQVYPDTIGYPYILPIYPYRESYAIWWVNGPLEMGSTLEVLSGYASVRGETTVPMNGDSWDAWMVVSRFVDKNVQYGPPQHHPEPLRPYPDYYPYPIYYSSNSTRSVSLEFDYEKSSDLLLRARASIENYNEFGTIYPPGYYVYRPPPDSAVNVTKAVTVTRTYSASLDVSLDIISTSIEPGQRMALSTEESGSGGSAESNNPPAADGNGNTAEASMAPLVYGVSGAIAAVLVSGGIWVATRNRRSGNGENSPAEIQPAL